MSTNREAARIVEIITAFALIAVLGGCGSASKTAVGPTGKPSALGKGSVRVSYTAPPGTTPEMFDRLATNLRHRAKQEHLDDVTIAVSGSSITVSGRVAEKDRILALAAPGVLQFRVVLGQAAGSSHAPLTSWQPGVANPDATVIQDFVTTDCANQTPQTGLAMAANGAIAACDLNHQAKYLLDAASVSGTDVSAASAAQEATGGANSILTGNWEVDLSLDSVGTKAFADVSQKLYQNGGQFALVMDGIVYSAPTVQSPITDGKARITGSFTQKDAENLAAVLQAGALPVHLTLGDIAAFS